MSLNQVTLIGRLGADPKVSYTQSGKAVANFSLATEEAFLDDDGQRRTRTEWHRIVVWGKTAESCGEYLRKGRQVCVVGRLQTREWSDREGHKRFTTEVVAMRVEFLGSSPQNSTPTTSQATHTANAQRYDNGASHHPGGQSTSYGVYGEPQSSASYSH
ncbi:MAG: single-stranded DNA-binding protein [Planctomycetota bacterium]